MATLDRLQASWVWITPWRDSSPAGDTCAQLVTFQRPLHLDTVPSTAVVHCTADTRYKLIVNGTRVTVGPARSSPDLWLYDTIDVAPFLRAGDNEITVHVLRFHLTARAGFPFVRSPFAGLTVVGTVGNEDVGTLAPGWRACTDSSIKFPCGRPDDIFLNIYERAAPGRMHECTIVPYAFKTVNGELGPWRLRPRPYGLPEQAPVAVDKVYAATGLTSDEWSAGLRAQAPLVLPARTHHMAEFGVPCHSTAFTRWQFTAAEPTSITLRITYAECYEYLDAGRRDTANRSKGDRLDSANGHLMGPYDVVTLDVGPQGATYEPFWWRTFRMIRLELDVGAFPVTLVSFEATQTNYALDPKASWREPTSPYADRIWDISVRTLRNCMFDGFSDCPFYEQLQYAGDTRSVALFHYLLCGDDRLARQAIVSFASSVSIEGLTHSRYPSHIPQLIAGFPLYWCMMVADHMLYFGDAAFARSLLPRMDGVLAFFDTHVDALGLVSGISADIWQWCDWVDGWHATDAHPDKGVPTAGRKSNRHTFFSMLYALALQRVSGLLRQMQYRVALADEYTARADALVAAIRTHCYDGHFFTDSTADVAPTTLTPMSQHCQVYAVLCGIVTGADAGRLLADAFAPGSTLGKCSYVHMFYAFRAFAMVGSDFYESMFRRAFAPWRRMVDNNLTTWEEDDVRQRSDCHAWGSVPIYEFCVEVAGVEPLEPGCRRIAWHPRVELADGDVSVAVALGVHNVARVSSSGGRVHLELDKAVDVVVRQNGVWTEYGVVDKIQLKIPKVA